MRTLALFSAVFSIWAGVCAAVAVADDAKDCSASSDLDRRIQACTNLIKRGRTDKKQLGVIYGNRGSAYVAKGAFGDNAHFDSAIADFTEAIRLDPKSVNAYTNRANAYTGKGDYDLSIADTTEAIRLDAKSFVAYGFRAVAHGNKGAHDLAMADANKAMGVAPQKYASLFVIRGFIHTIRGEYDRAIADLNEALRLDPKYADAYNSRSWAHNEKQDYDRAIKDASEAIRLNPKLAPAYVHRGRAHTAKGEHDRAIADLTESIRLDPNIALAYTNRGLAREAKGLRESAVADFRKALELPALNERARKAQGNAREQLARLARPQQQRADNVATIQAPASAEAPSLAEASQAGRRVALVIGNSDYRSAARLSNPLNDARAIAASLRRLGFADVIERYDLGLAQMGEVLKDFGDRTADADWAVVFFAGHGIELNGVAFLIPVDAKLERDTHVPDETVALSRVLEKVESARKLRLVILDACRNNPFLHRMVRTAGATRSIGRGLAQIEPEGAVLVAYSAKHGTTAEDGAGANSPFAEALLAYLEEPGLEINFLFRKVRDRVLEATRKRQEPYLYGSLSSETLYFRAAANR